MTKCKSSSVEFPALKSQKVELNFSGGEVSSDGGALLLREVDRKLQLTSTVAKYLKDNRNPLLIEHSNLDMLRQRVYGIALGYEDLNDQTFLRTDSLLQVTTNKTTPLASAPTLSRFENRTDREVAVNIHRVLVEKFIESFNGLSPQELILDLDATDDRVHGNQVKRFFNGYYEDYCFLPLYVFCGDQLLVSYLRPSNIDGAKHAWAICSLLIKRFRQVWPNVKITIRADSGFCRHQMLNWFERHEISYIIGVPGNSKLNSKTTEIKTKAKNKFIETQVNQKYFSELSYGASTWIKDRRIIVKAEYNDKGENTRFVVTNLSGDPQFLYEKIYCGRGEMENRIKEQQLFLFADRTSCHNWWPNQFRLLLSSLSYVLIETIRRTALSKTELAQAQVNTIRLKLLKIGAVIVKNTRRIKLFLSSHYPYQAMFLMVAKTLMGST